MGIPQEILAILDRLLETRDREFPWVRFSPLRVWGRGAYRYSVDLCAMRIGVDEYTIAKNAIKDIAVDHFMISGSTMSHAFEDAICGVSVPTQSKKLYHFDPLVPHESHLQRIYRQQDEATREFINTEEWLAEIATGDGSWCGWCGHVFDSGEPFLKQNFDRYAMTICTTCTERAAAIGPLRIHGPGELSQEATA